MHVIPGPQEQEYLRQAIEDQAGWLAELPGHIRRLTEIFGGHDAFDVLGGIQMAHAVNQQLPMARQDLFLDGFTALEYTAIVLLERPSRQPITTVPLFELETTIDHSLPHLRALVDETAAVIAGYVHSPARDVLASMHERFIRRYMYVPINETHEQSRVWTQEFFSENSIVRWMREELGFDVDDADHLITAMFERMLYASSEVIKQKRAGPSKGIGEMLSFTPEDIASPASVSAAAAFCETLATPFGQAWAWPTLPTPLRHRPLISDGQGRYFAPVPAMVRRGFRHAVAAALNPALSASGAGNMAVYQRYLARRGSLVESRAISPMRRFLRPDHAFSNLHFKLRRPDRSILEGEIDGLMVVDGQGIVLQAKSAPTRIDAVAADPEAFVGALSSIVTESMRQHDDARSALRGAGESVRLWSQPNSHVALDQLGLSRRELLPITVTLDDLSGCAPASWELREAGIATQGPLPWLVGVTPLEIMLELLTFPAQFVHFLRRRSELNDAQNLDVQGRDRRLPRVLAWPSRIGT